MMGAESEPVKTESIENLWQPVNTAPWTVGGLFRTQRAPRGDFDAKPPQLNLRLTTLPGHRYYASFDDDFARLCSPLRQPDVQ